MGRLQDGRIRIAAGGPSFEVLQGTNLCDGHGLTAKTSLVSSFFFQQTHSIYFPIFFGTKVIFWPFHPQANNQLAQTNSYFIGIFWVRNFSICIYLVFCLRTRSSDNIKHVACSKSRRWCAKVFCKLRMSL